MGVHRGRARGADAVSGVGLDSPSAARRRIRRLAATVPSDLVELLRCPNDGRALRRCGEDALVCGDGERYAVQDGIPDLAPGEDGTAFRPDRLSRLADLEDWHFWFLGRRALVVALVRELIPRPAKVLDIGCGNGAMLAALVDDGYQTVGVDALAPGLHRARRRLPGARVARASARRLPFANGAFDAAVVLDLLEHADDRAVLAQALCVLRPGGMLIASVPAGSWLWSYRDDDAGHLRRYSRTSVRALLRASEFEIVSMRGYQALLLPVLAVTRLLGRNGPRLRDLEERPSPRLNRVLAAVTRAELALGRLVPPFGSSLVVAARKR
jgi:SAM-dependent methyltransferase